MPNKARIVKQKKMMARAMHFKKDVKKDGKVKTDYSDPKRHKTRPKDKWKTRAYNRCEITGRPRGYMRDFGISRCLLRELADRGQIPGMRKSSW